MITMKFAVRIDYAPERERLLSGAPAHRVYFRGLLADGRLLAAGPFTDDAGALWISQADTPEQAEQMVRNDPYAASGVFANWQVHRLAYWSAEAHKGK